jgi:hypothetical protein
MKRVNYIVAGVTVLLVVLLTSIQPRREKAPPAYNAAAEVTVSGVVAETREFFCPVSDDQGLHLVLRTDQGELFVHVGPARFLRAQELKINPGDTLSIIGTRVRYQDQNAFLAREITRGNEVMILRDHQGRPLWLR